MVYLYKKIVKEKPYYYLRMSKRAGGKVISKDIAYLGSDISKIQPKISKLPDKYKLEIRKTYRNINKFIESEHYLNKVKDMKLKETPFLEKKLLEEVEAIKLHYNKVFQKLDDLTKKESYKGFLIDFAFNTTSLEGNTITLVEAQKLLTENLTPANRTLKEIHDLQNTESVFFELLGSKKKIGHKLIIDIHDNLLENIDARKGYRIHDTRVFRATFEASPYQYVKTDIDLLLEWFDQQKKEYHPLVIASMFHQKFEKIHPFADGNGRTGRIILNLMLMQSGYPPIIVRKSRRNDYLNAMSKANKVGLKDASLKNFRDLSNYLAEEMIDGYWSNFLV